MTSERDDYDSPWKLAIERCFREFVRFYFPHAHDRIDWSKGYEFLDQELQAVVQDAELGRRYVDKLARVTLLTGDEDLVYCHFEVQGRPEDNFGERVFVYNYRLYDRYRRPIASLVVLADQDKDWRPDGFGYEALGCRVSISFPVVKLLDYAGREAELLADSNPFALLTAATLMARATRQDMSARFDAKWRLVRSLYHHGWDRQRIIDLFGVLDWMMRLPEALERELWQNIKGLETEVTMRYVTSVERIGRDEGRREGHREGRQEGHREGTALTLILVLEARFGSLAEDQRAQILAADMEALEGWVKQVMTAPSVAAILNPPVIH